MVPCAWAAHASAAMSAAERLTRLSMFLSPCVFLDSSSCRRGEDATRAAPGPTDLQPILKLRLALLAEGRNPLLVVLGQPQLLVGVALHLEPDADAGLVGGRQDALDGLERERRLRRELCNRVVDLLV